MSSQFLGLVSGGSGPRPAPRGARGSRPGQRAQQLVSQPRGHGLHAGLSLPGSYEVGEGQGGARPCAGSALASAHRVPAVPPALAGTKCVQTLLRFLGQSHPDPRAPCSEFGVPGLSRETGVEAQPGVQVWGGYKRVFEHKQSSRCHVACTVVHVVWNTANVVGLQWSCASTGVWDAVLTFVCERVQSLAVSPPPL